MTFAGRSMWFCLMAVILASVGCRSGKRSIDSARAAYAAGDLESAATALEALSDQGGSDQPPSELDLAIVELACGQPEAAESRLRQLRDQLDPQAEQLSPADAVALATDDNARPFQLADYEHVLLRSMLAVCSLASDGVDAEAYCLQAHRLQDEYARCTPEGETGPTTAGQVALAPYLRGILREATHQDYDDAQRAFRLVSSMRPDFKPVAEDIQRVEGGTHSRSGHGVLYVFAFVGQGPRLVETVAPTTTGSLQIASVLLRSIHKKDQGDEDQVVLPNIASVKVPVVEIPHSPLASIGISLSGQSLGATQTLTDIGQLAVEHSRAEMPQTIARAVVRRVLKEASVTAASGSLGLSGDAASAFEFATINAWSATERADTRCWSLLPREIQVLRAELPSGSHAIDLMPIGYDGQLVAPATKQSVVIEDGRNHYCFIVAPEQIVSIVQSTLGGGVNATL